MPEFYEGARYDAELRSYIESIYSGVTIERAIHEYMGRIFAPSHWQTVGLPRDIQRADTEAKSEPVEPFEAEFDDAWISLFDTLRRFGEHDLFIAARPEDTKRPAEPVVAAACAIDHREIRAAERLGHFMVYSEHLVFGRKPVWGMVTHWESFTILGGTAEFIASYVAAAGDVEAVRRRFENQIDSQFRSEGGGEKLDRFADRIVRSMRWPA